jgi:hypothetical protein
VLLGAVALFGAIAAHAQYPVHQPTHRRHPRPAARRHAARVVGKTLGALLGQPVVVANHAGGNGNIARRPRRQTPRQTALTCCSARPASSGSRSSRPRARPSRCHDPREFATLIRSDYGRLSGAVDGADRAERFKV